MTFWEIFLQCTFLLFSLPPLLLLSCLVLCREPAEVKEVKGTKKKNFKLQVPLRRQFHSLSPWWNRIPSVTVPEALGCSFGGASLL